MTDELEQLKKQQAEIQRQIDVETAKFQDQLYELKKQQAEIKNQLVTKETGSQSQSQDSSANQTPEITTSFIYKGRVISKRNGEWKINDDFKRFKSLEEAERYIDTVLLPPRIGDKRRNNSDEVIYTGIQHSETKAMMLTWGIIVLICCGSLFAIFGSYKAKANSEITSSSNISNLKKGTVYKTRNSGTCSKDVTCIDDSMYEKLCKKAEGFTKLGFSTSAHAFQSTKGQFLAENGQWTNSNIKWEKADSNKPSECIARLTFEGYFKGNSARWKSLAVVHEFLFSEEGKVLVHHSRFMYEDY